MRKIKKAMKNYIGIGIIGFSMVMGGTLGYGQADDEVVFTDCAGQYDCGDTNGEYCGEVLDDDGNHESYQTCKQPGSISLICYCG